MGQRFPVQIFSIPIRFRDCLCLDLEPGSDSGSETVKVQDTIPIPVLRPNMPIRFRFQDWFQVLNCESQISSPIPVLGTISLTKKHFFYIF